MDIIWKHPSQYLTINPQEVHIWKTNLEQSSINVQKSFTILNETEKNKAQRFRFEKHQKRFTIARSTLKRILSIYLSIPPQAIEFQYNDYGKPQILEIKMAKKKNLNILVGCQPKKKIGNFLNYGQLKKLI